MTSVVDAPDLLDQVDADRRPEHAAARFPTGFVLVSVGLSILLRARFLVTPLTSDEGGYLAVARAWASGKSLYGDAWVDRPQGLLILYRLWDDLTGGSTVAIRIMAMLFGCVAVVAVAYVAYAIAGAQAAAVAAVFIAIASANARIEGFIANGELLAGAVGACGVAAACAYLFRGQGLRWLYIAGVLASCAISIKQSGFDGFAAVMMCIVAGRLTGERTWRQVAREAGVCFAGAATVLGLLVLHGITVGFGNWWYAVAGYRLSGVNASDANWHRFGITSRLAAPTLLPLAGLALLGIIIWAARSRRISRSMVLIVAWICFAVVGFMAGGLFHRHYWITLTFPLAIAAGVALAKVKAPIAVALVCAAIIPSLVSSAHVIVLDRSEIGIVADDDPRLLVDEAIGRWYAADVRAPGTTFYVLCASAGAYAATDTVPPYPYLWLDGVQHGRDAQEKLVNMFAGDSPPTFVARYQTPFTCNPSGVVEDLIRQRYTQVANVRGALIFRLREPLPAVTVLGSKMPSRRT